MNKTGSLSVFVLLDTLCLADHKILRLKDDKLMMGESADGIMSL